MAESKKIIKGLKSLGNKYIVALQNELKYQIHVSISESFNPPMG